MGTEKTIPTWDELLAIMNDEKQRPDDIGWNIYRYLNANYAQMSSEEARTMLLCYLKLPVVKPSLLHSCMLAVAVKMAKQFNDFKFPQFLTLWGYGNLRKEDFEKAKSKDGKSFSSLIDKVVHSYFAARIRHSEYDTDDNFKSIIFKEAENLGYIMPLQMVAVKSFDTEVNGRKMHSIKLIGSKGEEAIADSHIFECKPWEITGKLYNVLLRKSKESGKVRVADIAASRQMIENVFGSTIGYVDRYDSQHGHYHVFDSESRHFVAEKPAVKPNVGDYVWFAPIIPEKDKFKSAIIIKKESKDTGRNVFGIQKAQITYINTEKDFFRYKIAENNEGTATTSTLFSTPPKVGDNINIIVYLRRGMDGNKRNHLAEIV